MNIESQVKDFYNENYQKFVDLMSENCKVLDAGCGNGKNMIYIKNKFIEVVGIDFSEKLIEICKNKSLNVINADIRNLPFKDNSFNFVMSIAVIHHLSCEEDRYKSINEMLRVCKPGGKVLISLWAFEQPEKSRFNFILGDNYVKWDATCSIKPYNYLQSI